VDSGQYTSASEVVREAIRQWLERRIAADVAALGKAHAGAWEWDNALPADVGPSTAHTFCSGAGRAQLKSVGFTGEPKSSQTDFGPDPEVGFTFEFVNDRRNDGQ
jgi:Arc/MetJ-type ribon-helix-helix transcriptional regulator